MNSRSFAKYLYGWLRVFLTSYLAVVLVLTVLAISPEKVDATPGAVQDQLQTSIKRMNSAPEVEGALMPIDSYSEINFSPYTRGVIKPDFSRYSSDHQTSTDVELLNATEISSLGFWLNLGKNDWVWGIANLDVDVSVEINGELAASAHSDSGSGEWGIDQPIDINPGDEVTVTAGAGLMPVVIMIPDPLTVQADSLTEVVWGQVGGRSEGSVEIHNWWSEPQQDTTTDVNGNFSATFSDVPYGGEGNLYYNFDQDGTSVDMNVYFRTPDLVLSIHADHEWVEGNYEPGHNVYLTIFDNLGVEKASISMETGPIEDWGGESGFTTYLEGQAWVPQDPDIQPGDVIHGEVDDGSQYFVDVEVGTITGTPDVAGDRISGTVDADWLLPGPVDIICSIWEENGKEVETSVIPDGEDTYTCVFSGDNTYDIVPGTNLMVGYFEPDGHLVLGDFSPPAPYLKIEKWFIGGGSPGEGGNAAFWVQYQNHGGLAAEDVTITDTLVGMTYLSDTSGITPTGSDTEKTWDFGTVDSSDWIGFIVFTDVTGAMDDPWSNTVEISTSNPFDGGDEDEKISTQEGTITGNDTHLNVGKDTWTWNPAPGEDFFYQINVCNNGSTGSSAVTVTETYPDATILINWWGDLEGWQEISHVDHTLVLEHTCISPNSCTQVYLHMRLDGSTHPGDELVNHVEIAADNDLETEDNIAELHHNVGEPYFDLAVWQDWHWGSLVPSGEYYYGINFKNEGNVAVSGPIEVTATLPDGVGFVGWDYWDKDWGIPEPTIVDNVITWEVQDILPGKQGTIELWIQIDPGVTPGTILEHVAEIEIQDGEENTDNNFNKLKEMVNTQGPNLRIWKYGWEQGDHVGYRIHVENVGDKTVEDISIIDDYSDLMQLEGGINVNYGDWWDWQDDDPEEGAFTVTLDRLEPGWGADIDYTMLILETEPLGPGIVFENTAEIHPFEEDVYPDDNVITWVLGTGPDLFVEKTLHEGVFEPGEQVTYRLAFGNKRNDGAWSWDMQGHIILTDMLPDEMQFVSAYVHHCGEEVWGGVETTSRGQALSWSLYPEGSDFCYEILLTVEIDSKVAFTDPLINQAMVESSIPEVDIDPFPENNSCLYDPGRNTFNTFVPLILR